MYTVKFDTDAKLKVVVDSMILTTDSETNAGSKMLKGYTSLLEAEALTRLKSAGYGLSGKTAVGEFAIDLLGETSVDGTCARDGVLAEVRKREHYEKPSVKRKKKSEAARKRKF